MSKLSDDALILTFAENLISKKVETEAVMKSLIFLCKHFSFAGSAVYEIDQYNQFHSKERTDTKQPMFRDILCMEEIKEEYQELLRKEDCVCLYQADSASPFERMICSLFKCASILLYPVLDNNQNILGFFAFLSQKKHKEISQKSNHTLHIALSILAKYVARRMYENKLSFAITSLESILDHTGIDIYVNDFHSHDILYVNKSMAHPYGGVEVFKNRKCWQVLFPAQSGPCEFCPQKNIIDEKGNPTKVYSWDYQRAFDGSWFRVFSAAFRWVDGRLAHVVSSADITDNKKYEATIHHMANYDPLTDLPNRRMLIEECEKRIDKATSNEKGYILFFDIDGFKTVNDTLGHDAGDEFLIQLAKFFRNIPMLKNAIYRNGGDEFIAIIGGEDISKDMIRNLAGFIHQRFNDPWNLKNGKAYCGVSIGIACYPEDGKTADLLISIADHAMYKVKKQQKNSTCFGYEL